MTNIEAIQKIEDLISTAEALMMGVEALKNQNHDMVSRDCYNQVRWERDIAISQLEELGYSLGEKIRKNK